MRRYIVLMMLGVGMIPKPADARVLHMVTSLNSLEAKEYIEAFEKDSGIKVEWIRLSSGEVLARLKTEGNKITQSVWFGGPVPEYVAIKEEGLLQPYRPPNIDLVPEKWRDPEGYWIGIYYGYIGFITNNEFLKKHKIDPPRSWQDLLLPVWKGHVTVSYPYTAGTGYTIFAGLVSMMGLDDAIAYWKKLDESIQHYTKSGSAPVLEVGLGEAAVGAAFSQDILRKGTMQNFPITLTFPDDGVPFEIGGVAIMKGAPELEEAKAFVKWIISRPAQDIMHLWARTPIIPTAKVGSDMKHPDEIKLIDMDFVKLGRDRRLIIDRWRSELKQ